MPNIFSCFKYIILFSPHNKMTNRQYYYQNAPIQMMNITILTILTEFTRASILNPDSLAPKSMLSNATPSSFWWVLKEIPLSILQFKNLLCKPTSYVSLANKMDLFLSNLNSMYFRWHLIHFKCIVIFIIISITLFYICFAFSIHFLFLSVFFFNEVYHM